MNASWTFGQKMGLGFAVLVAFNIVTSVVAMYALQSAVASKDLVITVQAQNLVDAHKLQLAVARRAGAARGYLLTKNDIFRETSREMRAQFASTLDRFKKQRSSDSGTLLGELERREAEYQAALDQVMTLRATNASLTLEALGDQFEDIAKPKHDAVLQTLGSIVDIEQKAMDEGKQASTDAAQRASMGVAIIALTAVGLALVLALMLGGTLNRQVGSAVQHIQSSSAELQAAANQQASGTREQVSAMTEITTTIRELLSTSRQISESAQRVVTIAEATHTAARQGDQVVQKTQEAVALIKRQVDLVVTHMLDLGKRSQQIGNVLEIVNELLEQTNIVAINATIEASGAGEHGKRFAAVADEIRKLSDRVGGSAREIRSLVDEVRAAVNSTVMATEGGAKAVDSGTKQFGDVTLSFRQIVDQVGTTTEAAREIELSTKQQTSAVEQVNTAIANVSQAAKESEASATQTLQTASELSSLSRDLARMVRAEAGA